MVDSPPRGRLDDRPAGAEHPGGADSTRQADPSLSLIIPAYNEATRIAGTIREAVAWLDGQPFDTELIVVDDGSDDATADLAAARCRSSGVAGCCASPRGQGRGGARRDAGGDLRADRLQRRRPRDTAAIPRRATRRAGRGCDIAIGSREGAGRGGSASRRIAT